MVGKGGRSLALVGLQVTRSHSVSSVPKLYGTTKISRDQDYESIPTHELFTKLGFFSHPNAGLVNWHPLGLLLRNKLSNLIHGRMREIGAEEVFLSALASNEMMKQTDRWENSELFKLKDSSDHEFCLAATCEEQITNVVKENVSSYKSLPLMFYQISEKFRDERRPRGGLLRGREFLMKDAYSFDKDKEGAMKSYDKVVAAYRNIFGDLKIPFVQAEADSGNIGGSLSHEWHYLHKSGEDTLSSCPECGNLSNIEKTLSFPTEIDESLAVSVRYFITQDKSTLVCAYYPSERVLQPTFIKEEVPDIDFIQTNEQVILGEFSNEETLITKKVVRIMDSRLSLRSNFPDFPVPFVNRSLITTLTDIPIVSAEEGELCAKCEEGNLQLNKAIEVGHTFYLGSKYSKPLNCSVDVPQEDGLIAAKSLEMGCYGIGVSRIIAAIGEISRDSLGFRWPAAIAPWTLTVVEGPRSQQSNLFKFLDNLNKSAISYRLDDRQNVRFGAKLHQSHATGIPLVAIVGKQFPLIELEVRAPRYSNHNLAWIKLYSTRDFDWEVVYDQQGKDCKHIVDINRFLDVYNSLIVDM